jgi:hypothetical protein
MVNAAPKVRAIVNLALGEFIAERGRQVHLRSGLAAKFRRHSGQTGPVELPVTQDEIAAWWPRLPEVEQSVRPCVKP